MYKCPSIFTKLNLLYLYIIFFFIKFSKKFFILLSWSSFKRVLSFLKESSIYEILFEIICSAKSLKIIFSFLLSCLLKDRNIWFLSKIFSMYTFPFLYKIKIANEKIEWFLEDLLLIYHIIRKKDIRKFEFKICWRKFLKIWHRRKYRGYCNNKKLKGAIRKWDWIYY